MQSANSDLQLNKLKLQVYTEIRKTNPKFKFRQMNKIKFGFQLVQFMQLHNISRDILASALATGCNYPVKNMNRRSNKALNNERTEVEPSKKASEYQI